MGRSPSSAMEAVSFAGHQKLDNLILIYDDNLVTLDAMADTTQSEDCAKRFEAIGWHVQRCAPLSLCAEAIPPCLFPCALSQSLWSHSGQMWLDKGFETNTVNAPTRLIKFLPQISYRSPFIPRSSRWADNFGGTPKGAAKPPSQPLPYPLTATRTGT